MVIQAGLRTVTNLRGRLWRCGAPRRWVPGLLEVWLVRLRRRAARLHRHERLRVGRHERRVSAAGAEGYDNTRWMTMV